MVCVVVVLCVFIGKHCLLLICSHGIRRPYPKIPARNRYEYDYPNKEKDDDSEEEDNWELLDVDVPYS